MARADQKEGLLRGCPTCGTKVDEAKLGMRDFSWVNEALPGKVGLMDIDGCLNQAATQRGLFFELKPKGAYLSTGAKLTFAMLARVPLFNVWVVWEEENNRVRVAKYDDEGNLGPIRSCSRATLVRQVVAWWNAGL